MNNITINLSAEDRARIDTLNTALGMLISHLEGVNAANEAKGLIETKVVDEVIYTPETVIYPHKDTHKDYWDTQGLHQEPAEAPQEVVEEQTPLETENTQDEPQEVKNEAPVPTVTKQDILQKVIALCGVGKKAEAKNIITTYADSVSDLPDSALVEVWDKLTALEV